MRSWQTKDLNHTELGNHLRFGIKTAVFEVGCLLKLLNLIMLLCNCILSATLSVKTLSAKIFHRL